MVSLKTPVFVRDATGLVKSFTSIDMFYFNFAWAGGLWTIVYTLSYSPLYGGEPISSFFVMGLGVLCIVYVYYAYTSALPRSGGDYVWMSRAFPPSIGLALNFAGIFWTMVFFIGVAAATYTTAGLAPAFSAYAALSGQTWAAGVASEMVDPFYVILLGVVAILFFAIVILYSTPLYMKIQNVLMTLAVIGTFIVIVALALTSTTAFASEFDQFAANAGATNLYEQWSSLGATSAPPIYDFGATLSLVPLWMFIPIWSQGSNYLAGELKNTRRNAGISMLGSFAFTFIVALVTIVLAYSRLGYNFLYGADSAYFGSIKNPLSVAPNLTLYVSILTGNPLIALFLGVAISAGFLLVAPACMLMVSRLLFAYSFDRLLPSSMASINSRGSPTRAIVAATIGGLVFLGIFTAPQFASIAIAFTSYGNIPILGLTNLGMCIAAIVIPYKKKELYKTAFAERKIAGVPLTVLAGIIGAIYLVGFWIAYLYYGSLYLGGLYAGLIYGEIPGVIVLFFVCIAWYKMANRYHKARDIEISKAYAEIPPE